jgi:hypothetical protein
MVASSSCFSRLALPSASTCAAVRPQLAQLHVVNQAGSRLAAHEFPVGWAEPRPQEGLSCKGKKPDLMRAMHT